MNIIEAYLKVKQLSLIIIISGLSGSNKNKLAGILSEDFNFKHIKQRDYYKSDYENKTELREGVQVNNCHTDDAIDWAKLNNDIKSLSDNGPVGIVISGEYFPTDKLEFTPSLHYHIKLSKQNIIKRRYMFAHKTHTIPEGAELITPDNLAALNKFEFTHYMAVSARSTITKYINANDYVDMPDIEYDTKVYDIIFDNVIEYVKGAIYENKERSELLGVPTGTSNNKQDNQDKSTQVSRYKMKRQPKYDAPERETSTESLSEPDTDTDITDTSEDDGTSTSTDMVPHEGYQINKPDRRRFM